VLGFAGFAIVAFELPAPEFISTTVWIIPLQRGASGFIADELPLQATPLYRDEPRKVSRSDVEAAV